jgi:hypothetical protein
VLSFGSAAEVLEPADLREEMRLETEAMARRYARSAPEEDASRSKTKKSPKKRKASRSE